MPRRNNNRIQPKGSNNQSEQNKKPNLKPNSPNKLPLKNTQQQIYGWHYIQKEEIPPQHSFFTSTRDITSNLGEAFEMINIQTIQAIR